MPPVNAARRATAVLLPIVLALSSWSGCATTGGGLPAPQPPSGDLLGQLIRVRGCQLERHDGFVRLSARTGDQSLVQTTAEFAPPLAIHLRGRTDSSNLRLYYGVGQLIFNWEAGADELRVHDPASWLEAAAADEGWIGEMEWRDITWEILPDRMRVRVDGELRYECAGEYAGLREGVGVGPAWGSVVDVASLTVTGASP